MAGSKRDDRAKKLPSFAGGEGDHRVADERDADFVGEAAVNFFAVDETHTPIVSRAMQSRARSQ